MSDDFRLDVWIVTSTDPIHSRPPRLSPCCPCELRRAGPSRSLQVEDLRRSLLDSKNGGGTDRTGQPVTTRTSTRRLKPLRETVPEFRGVFDDLLVLSSTNPDFSHLNIVGSQLRVVDPCPFHRSYVRYSSGRSFWSSLVLVRLPTGSDLVLDTHYISKDHFRFLQRSGGPGFSSGLFGPDKRVVVGSGLRRETDSGTTRVVLSCHRVTDI